VRFPAKIRSEEEGFAYEGEPTRGEQTAYALRQAELGTPVVEVVRKMGVSDQAFYRWKKKYAGMGVGEIRRLKQLEEENRKLKQLMADFSLD
jgi:putative transposase